MFVYQNEILGGLLIGVGSAVPVYFFSFLDLKRSHKTLLDTAFKLPTPRPIDKNLVLGSIIFEIQRTL